MKRFRGGLVFKAQGLVYYSTLGWRAMKKKKKILRCIGVETDLARLRHATTFTISYFISRLIKYLQLERFPELVATHRYEFVIKGFNYGHF